MNSPPTEKRNSLVKFNFNNMANIQITKLNDESHSVYEIKIPNPKQISFESSDENNAYFEFKNFLLAINFHLTTVCVTSSKSTFNSYKIDLKPKPNEPYSQVLKKIMKL